MEEYLYVYMRRKKVIYEGWLTSNNDEKEWRCE